MSNKNTKDSLNEKLIELTLLNEAKLANQTINFINTRIKFYITLLDRLEESKPLFFQKKKLLEYNQKIKEYNDKIDELYTELDEEVSLLDELCTSI